MADPAISVPAAGTLAPVASSGASWLARARNRISPDRAYDGAYVGEQNGTPAAFGASSDPDAVPAVQPDPSSYGASHREAPGDLIVVNGIDTPWRGEYADAKLLANQTGQPVVGVHVATTAVGNAAWSGSLVDGIETLASRHGYAAGHAPATLGAAILERLRRNEPVHIVAHSRGAIVTAQALEGVRAQLLANGDSPAQARAELAQVQVETFGGAESSYPDGPQYVHYMNRKDPVAEYLGLGESGAHPGEGATTLFYDDARFGPHDLDPAANHHFAGPYLSDERVPFALARSLGPNQPDAIADYVANVAMRPDAHPQPLVAGP